MLITLLKEALPIRNTSDFLSFYFNILSNDQGIYQRFIAIPSRIIQIRKLLKENLYIWHEIQHMPNNNHQKQKGKIYI